MSVKEPHSPLQLVFTETESDGSGRGSHHLVDLPSDGSDPNCDPGRDTASNSSP
jgi:hypothetical protein